MLLRSIQFSLPPSLPPLPSVCDFSSIYVPFLEGGDQLRIERVLFLTTFLEKLYISSTYLRLFFSYLMIDLFSRPPSFPSALCGGGNKREMDRYGLISFISRLFARGVNGQEEEEKKQRKQENERERKRKEKERDSAYMVEWLKERKLKIDKKKRRI